MAAALTLMAGPAAALEVCLKAVEFTGNYPGGAVTMWGYQDYSYNTAAVPGACDWSAPVSAAASVPGPAISVPVGDSSLNIHLLNDLPVGTPTSVVIAGQSLPTGSAPVRVDGRIRSAVHETASGMEGLYSWPNIAPGTYLYRTGTHPQVQQQMGLYGAVTQDSGAGEAYPGVAYQDQAVVLYSEIDPALHAAVAGGQYGPGTGMTSTIGYSPSLFLINGQPYDSAAPAASFPVTQNSNALLRLLNAGLESHVPMTVGLRMRLVAEDGSAYSHPRNQYSALLAAGTTLDAIVVPGEAGSYALVDRAMGLTNNGSGPGGMIAFLQATAASVPLTAAADAYATDEDVVLAIAAPGVLGNDGLQQLGDNAVLVSNVAAEAGSVALAADGSFVYTPAADFNGSAQFTYRKANGSQVSAPATVTITVNPMPDAPVAVADAYDVLPDTALNVAGPGVLDNDTDVDGDALTAVPLTDLATPAGGVVTLLADGSFTYTPLAGYIGGDSFAYQATDGVNVSAPATVTLTVAVPVPPVNQAPVAVDDQVQATKGSTVLIAVLDNDYDPDGTLNPATVTIVDGPSRGKGTVSVDPATGVITYIADPFFGGTELFTYTVQDDAGAVSNLAKVKVNLVK